LGIATFSVTASSGTTMTYQWYKDGMAIAGATSSSYTILSVLGSSAGNYFVKVSNAGGWVMSNNATLNVQAPPAIITQPQSQTVTQNDNVSFSVIASGTGPLSYQWYFKGVSMGAAGTNATLTLLNVQTNQAGPYKVTITNSMGSVSSSIAQLSVLMPAGISTQPQSQVVVQGQTASFTVVASGTSPMHYQWSFNNSPLSGATSSVLTLANVQSAQAGNYSVLVNNRVASVSSASASLVVNPATISVSLPPGQVASTGGGFTFQLSVPVGLTYTIMASTDLQAWTPIATNVATGPTMTFTDPAAATYPLRFYRAVLTNTQ
jgi:hypothetical protein